MITLCKKEDKKPFIKNLSEEIAEEFVEKDQLKTDPLGSWTGTPADENEVPTQDADDL